MTQESPNDHADLLPPVQYRKPDPYGPQHWPTSAIVTLIICVLLTGVVSYGIGYVQGENHVARCVASLGFNC